MIHIEGGKELIKRIDTIQKFGLVKGAIKSAASFLRGKIAVYPAASSANDTGYRRWYQRGYGPKWRLKDGAVHGRKTSENLRKSWTMATENYGFRAIVGTNVSYAPYVQDRDEQNRYHKWRGWITVQGVRNLYGRQAIAFIEAALEEEVGGNKK